MTDNESKQVNARDPTKHAQIGMKTNYTGGCVDHTTEEVALARKAFKKIMVDALFDPLSIIQGTSNRWFYKYSEAHRALRSF